MTKTPVLLAVLLSLSALASQGSVRRPSCSESGPPRMKLTLKGRRNPAGDWETEISASNASSKSSVTLSPEIKKKILECIGNTLMEVEGLTQEVCSAKANEYEDLLFHAKHGKGVKVVNDGRSAYKKHPGKSFGIGYGTVLSSRPLVDDELFEVRVEDTTKRYGVIPSIGVGLTSLSEDSFVFPYTMMRVRSDTWMVYYGDLYVNGNVTSPYGENLEDLKAGDRVGVMRKGDGGFHVFINGVDKGAAECDVPGSVYGVIDLVNGVNNVTNVRDI